MDSADSVNAAPQSPPMGEREQQLILRTIQQEEELRFLRRQLQRAQQSDNQPRGSATPKDDHARSPRRPRTASESLHVRRTYGVTSSSALPIATLLQSNRILGCIHLERDVPVPGSAQPPPVESLTALPFEGKAVVFGGTSGPQIYSDVWTYAIGEKRWRRLRCTGAVPPPLHSHTAVEYQKVMYVYGGYGQGGTPARVNGEPRLEASSTSCGLMKAMRAFNLRTHEWTMLSAEGPEPVKNHSAVVYKGRMFVFGGCVVGGRTNAIRVFDFESQQWLASEPFNTQAMYDDNSGAAVPDKARLSRSDVPAPRSGHSANVYARNAYGSMIVFGGRLSKYAFCCDAYEYNFDTRLWMRLFCGGQALAARCDHSAVIYKDHLFVMGGYSLHEPGSDHSAPTGAPVKVYHNDLMLLNLVSFTWVRVDTCGPERPLGCCGHAALLYETHDGMICMMVLGGWGKLPGETARKQVDVDAEGEGEEALAREPASNDGFSSLDDIWVYTIAKATPSNPVAAPRPPQADRPLTARQSARRAAASPRSRPIIVTTSKASTARIFSNPGYIGAKDDVVRVKPSSRSVQEIAQTVSRLTSSSRNIENLRSKYIVEAEPKKMTNDEQSQSVQRLYYQCTDERAEKAKKLETKWLPTTPRRRISEDTMQESIARLTQVAEKSEPPPPPKTRPTVEEQEEAVQRLYYLSRESHQKRLEELSQQLLWGAPAKKATKEAVSSVVSRLSATKVSQRR